ncbi:MAG: alpha/beta hydrolase family protein [Gemmatimonadaceae bacterium]
MRLTSALLVLPLVAASAQNRSDEWLRRPVDARTFETYRPFFAYDRERPFDTRTLDTSHMSGVDIEHLSFESTPGSRVFANLYEPAGTRGQKLRSVVMLHGGVARGKASMQVLADFLVKSGWRVLAIDMPYFGERATDLLVSFTEAEKHEKLYNQPATYLSWVTQVAKDAGRAVDFLVNERAADPSRIALVGYSRGAQAGAIVGAVEERFRAVALLYGGHFDAKETGHLAAACMANYIGRIAPRPLFLLNGTQDADYDRATQVEPLHRIARTPKTIHWVETGHIFPPVETRPVLARWLADAMPPGTE